MEQLNKSALQAHGLDKNGQLYKVNYFEFQRDADVIRLADDPKYNLSKFEEKLEVKGSSDHTKLIAMLNQLNDYSVPMSSILGKYFDTENLAYWMAFQLLTGNTDTQSRNMYLYSPTNSNTFYVLDWDNDGMLMRKENQIRNISTGSSWEQGVSNYWGNTLFRRCLQTKSFRDELDKAVRQEYHYMSANRINGMVTHYESITKRYLWKMPDSMYEPLTQSQYGMVAGQLHDEIEQNYKIYKEGFNKPMPFFIDAPQADNGKLKLSWDASFDFHNEDLSYDVTVAQGLPVQGRRLLQDQSGAVSGGVADLPADGQYFVRVQAATPPARRRMPSIITWRRTARRTARDASTSSPGRSWRTQWAVMRLRFRCCGESGGASGRRIGEELAMPPRRCEERYRHELKYLISYGQKADLNVRMAPLLDHGQPCAVTAAIQFAACISTITGTPPTKKGGRRADTQKYRIRIYDLQRPGDQAGTQAQARQLDLHKEDAPLTHEQVRPDTGRRCRIFMEHSQQRVPGILRGIRAMCCGRG